MCKRLKSDHAEKWHMHKPKSVKENEIHKILKGVEMHIDHPISATRPDLVLIKKKRTCQQVDFTIPVDHWMEIKESEMIHKYLDLAREIKKWKKRDWKN